MKKQFFRVKQLADQTFSRAGKTEVLSDDLQNADRKVDYIRTACHKTSKSLSSGLSTQGQDPAAKEKRLKKYPEHSLSVAMGESSNTTDDFLLRKILAECSKVQLELASEAFNHEVDVESKVVTSLNEIIDNEANISKCKRNLQKLILDMDSAKARYHTAKKQSDHRADAIREEMDDAELKVEQCRDTLASEMFVLISKEAQLAQSVVLYVKLQKEYHRSALTILEERYPELQQEVEDSPSKPVYGFTLEEHLRVTRRDIAFPIELCVCALLEFGVQEEGLFRVAGGTSKVKRMKHSFDACCLTLPIARGYGDPHVIASALKSYLRELPDPLLSMHLYDQWMSAAKVPDADARLQAMWMVLHKLPSHNYENLKYLVKFLAKLTESQSVNKMTPQNIAIVIAPNLIWATTEETSMGMNMNLANMYSSIVETLISHSEDYFFKGDIEFYVTMEQPEARDQVGERLQQNGMSRSVGPITITAQDDLDYYGPGHKRNNSNDTINMTFGESNEIKRTQSNSSLSDSPPHGGSSPKPATRRKNKPAPVPPANPNNPDKPPRPAATPAVVTLPRPAKKPLSDDTRSASSPLVESTKLIMAEKQTKADHFGAQDRSNPLRRSLDFEHVKVQENHHVKFIKQEHEASKPIKKETETLVNLMDHEFPKPAKPPSAENKPWKQQDTSKEENVKLLVNAGDDTVKEGGHPSSTMLIPTVVSASPFKVTVNQEQKGSGYPFQMSGSSTLDRKRLNRTTPLPVAAPRTTVDAKSTDDTAAAKEDSDTVRLRRVSVEGDRATKPAVPERPTGLQRPISVGAKTPRNSAELEALPDSERPSLERIHMYCVDKQQVSIIQVGGEREKTGGSVPSNESASTDPEPDPAPSPDVKAERPERPPKPEAMAAAPVRPAPPSHQRTLSEGNLIDACVGDAPRSRPPRPQPPPPPPPVKPRGEGAASESTDL